MSTIAENLQILSANISNAYAALSAKGATIPEAKTASNLSATIDTILIATS